MTHRLSPETVIGRFRYDPATGLIYWRVDRGSARVGDVAGSMHHKGYRHIKIDGRKYMGQFRDGKMDGAGRMTHLDGQIQDGLWKEGEFTGAKP